MKPRKVMHITRAVVGGVPVVVNEIVRNLDKNRYEPIVLFESHVQSDIRKKLHQSDIRTIDLKKTRSTQPSDIFKQTKKLNISGRLEANFSKEASQLYLSFYNFVKFLCKQAPRISSFIKAIKENKVDLIHTHSNLYLGKPEILASWLSGIPCVTHNHGYYRYDYFDKIFSRFVDAFIYISTDIYEHYASQGMSKIKGIIIHNGIDVDKFCQPCDTDSVRKEFNIKHDQTLVGIIGRIEYWKGHDFFLEAIAKARKQCPGIRAIIIGALENNVIINRNLKYYQKLKKMISSLGLEETVIFTGTRDDVPRLIAALDLVVHASSAPEPFGMVIIEGMSAGKPVIGTSAGGVLDIIEDQVNGLLVPCGDSASLAQAILQIISDPDKAKKMGIAARRCVTKKFTMEHQVMEVQNLYDSLFT